MPDEEFKKFTVDNAIANSYLVSGTQTTSSQNEKQPRFVKLSAKPKSNNTDEANQK